jgi:hypothetical protein
LVWILVLQNRRKFFEKILSLYTADLFFTQKGQILA